jgi:hypothetical protein
MAVGGWRLAAKRRNWGEAASVGGRRLHITVAGGAFNLDGAWKRKAPGPAKPLPDVSQLAAGCAPNWDQKTAPLIDQK